MPSDTPTPEAQRLPLEDLLRRVDALIGDAFLAWSTCTDKGEADRLAKLHDALSVARMKVSAC